MAAKQSFNWHHLNQLRQSTEITLSDHAIMDITIINHQKTLTRNKWKSCKKCSYELRKKFLSEQANNLATKMRTTEEKALRAIKRSEESRRIYHNIKELLGKQQQIFTQVDILNPSIENNHPHTTLTQQLDIEQEILSRNRRHSLQSYQTPFLSNSMLHEAISPEKENNKLDQFLEGSFLTDEISPHGLNENQRQWVKELKRIIDSEISLALSVEDFKYFFSAKQECTASSPSGRHMGHYCTLLKCLRNNNPTLPQLIIDIAYTSLITASSLNWWQTASQIMLEKGKGRFIDNLRMIQLCEADLNFVIHCIWGHRLIRHATKNKLLNESRYAIPGQTCNNAVINKILFFDLSRQSLTPGVLSDFDATAAFDRVIIELSIITCQRVGLPRVAGIFMYNLLKGMEFHLITGFGRSLTSYSNTNKNKTGQGVLQDSSSACPILILNSDVSLSAYQKHPMMI